MKIIDRLTGPEDLKKLSAQETGQLCQEIRKFLVESVSQTGGHLASNLGVVELTIALHKVYDTSRDRIVFDVGHQSYVHKLLTGRKDDFAHLRQYGGIAGFPKPSESDHDAFIGGHASDSVSVALGMARARTLSGQDYGVVAVLGDGALTGGLAYEGLSDAGESGEPLVVVLNDNGMSIAKNVGGVARYLSYLRLKPGYYRLKKVYRKVIKVIPGGKAIYRFTHRVKQKMKEMLLGCTIFDDMGFTYLGPVDGHDVDRLTYLLTYAKELNQPVLLHIITTKGRGYIYSERSPDAFHGVGAFDAENGRSPDKARTFSDAFGRMMCSMAQNDSRICAITAAMKTGTGLEDFAWRFPRRFFDVGIAEGHAVSMAAGLAKQGMVPVFAVYSTFLQRSYDMLIHDVALLGLHVVLAVDRAGLVGDDGETHHGVFDVGYLRQVPGMKIYCPASFSELDSMLRTAVEEDNCPVAVRYPRGAEGEYTGGWSNTGSRILKEGTQLTIAAYGTMINEALAAARLLEEQNISAAVVKIDLIAPLDTNAVLGAAEKTGRLVIVEESMAHCGIAGDLARAIAEKCMNITLQALDLGETFVQHGKVPQLRQERGIDAQGIFTAVMEGIKAGDSHG